MKLIKEVKEQDINPDAVKVDESNFSVREAARGVCFDSDGKVPLLHVGLYGFHKLPGGGIDYGEDVHQALARELLEEIGCKAEVQSEIGEVIEHRNQFELVQKSYCFTAMIVGEKGQPDFTESETEEQFSIVWADNLEHAIELLESDDTSDYEGKFIKIRDLAILRAAAK